MSFVVYTHFCDIESVCTGSTKRKSRLAPRSHHSLFGLNYLENTDMQILSLWLEKGPSRFVGCMWVLTLSVGHGQRDHVNKYMYTSTTYLPARSTRFTVDVLVILCPVSLSCFCVKVIATMVWARLNQDNQLSLYIGSFSNNRY